MDPRMQKSLDRAGQAVIRVRHGRGFVVKGEFSPWIITAAHCLKTALTCDAAEDVTMRAILGPLGKAKPTVWATCVFADPIGDIAVLGPPDFESLPGQFEEYEALTDRVKPLPVRDAPLKGPAWLMSLDGRWFQCSAIRCAADGGLWIEEAEGIIAGMSGSPILGEDGSAIGVVCVGSRCGISGHSHEGGPNARLARNLPGWMLREVGLLRAKPNGE